MTLTTGIGGASSGGASPGVSGNLLLKTGTGGGNATSSASGGNAGHIILQPGSGGSGTAGAGIGGSTIVRASNSGDILAVQNSAGTTTHLGVANDGNVRVGAASSTARLHLGGGTSTLAPLKFTAGTNLTSPQAGAMEFDGTNLFITMSDGTRRFLTSDVANVRDFGAPADGSTDDSTAVQDAADSLVDSGGVIYFPPGFKYTIANQVTIKSQLPVWVISQMSGAGYGAGSLGTTEMTASAVIQPGAGLTGSIFCWDYVNDLDDFTFIYGGPGGGISGIRFVDWNGSTGRNVDFEAAIHVKAAGYFTIRDCNFGSLQASAIKVTECVICHILESKAHRCGDTGKPALDIGGTLGTAAVDDTSTAPGHTDLDVDTVDLDLPDPDLIPVGTRFTIAGETGSPVHVVTARTGNPTTSITFSNTPLASAVADNAVITFYPFFSAVYGDWVFIEASFGDYAVKVHAHGGVLTGNRFYFENPVGGTEHPVFIDADGNVNLSNVTFNWNENTAIIMRGQDSTLRGVQGTIKAGALPIIKIDAPRCVLSGIDMNGQSGTGPAILVTANGFQSRISDVYFLSAGAIDASAASYVLLSNIYQLVPTCGAGTYAINLSFGSVLTGGFIDGGHVPNVVVGSLCNGVRAAGTTVTGVRVQRLGEDANGIVSTSSADVITGNSVTGLAAGDGVPFIKAAGAQFWGNHADAGTSHLTRIHEILTLPQEAWRNYTNNSVLTTTTTPTLTAEASNIGNRITWPAGDDGANAIRISFQLPPGFDGTYDITVEFDVSTDNAGGGGVDPATVGMYSSFDGGAAVFDGATDSSPSTAVHTITATIAAADIPDAAKRMALLIYTYLNPNDPTRIHDVRVKVARSIASL